jgi:hypothetical protein
MRTEDLPPGLAGPWTGRHLAGAGNDNLVLPPEGIVAASLTADQRDGLVELIRVYLDRLPSAQAKRDLALIRQPSRGLPRQSRACPVPRPHHRAGAERHRLRA